MSRIPSLRLASDQVTIPRTTGCQDPPETLPESSRHESVNNRVHTRIDKTAGVDQDLDEDEVTPCKDLGKTSNEADHIVREPANCECKYYNQHHFGYLKKKRKKKVKLKEYIINKKYKDILELKTKTYS